ncbi:MAG TPA: hypothetical protein VGL77_00320, partial [Armatimonadota bacterium]
MRQQVNAAEMQKLDILHRSEARAAAPPRRATKEGNLNRLTDGVLSSRLLSEAEREIFYALVAQFEHDTPPTTVVDQWAIELVVLLFLQIRRAVAVDKHAVIETLDGALRGHLRALKATKLSREAKDPRAAIGTPETWCRDILA